MCVGALRDDLPAEPGGEARGIGYSVLAYSRDGETWTRLTDGTNGIPEDWPTRVVREDPGREGLLYGGTEFGLFISFDNGAHWQPFQQNLPNVPMADLKVFRDDLILATQGRSFWILRGIDPLRQITPEMMEIVGGVKSILFGEAESAAVVSGPPPASIEQAYRSPLEQ